MYMLSGEYAGCKRQTCRPAVSRRILLVASGRIDGLFFRVAGSFLETASGNSRHSLYIILPPAILSILGRLIPFDKNEIKTT